MTSRRVRSSAAAAVLAATLVNPLATATAAEVAPSSTEVVADDTAVEEHVFTGSSTSAHALLAWINGGEYVQPEAETMDLTEFQVNAWETARSGDIIFKDEQGRFWIKQYAVVK